MARNPMTDNKEPDFSPTYEELINELTMVNSRLTIENIALKITIEKMRNFEQPSTKAQTK